MLAAAGHTTGTHALGYTLGGPDLLSSERDYHIPAVEIILVCCGGCAEGAQTSSGPLPPTAADGKAVEWDRSLGLSSWPKP